MAGLRPVLRSGPTTRTSRHTANGATGFALRLGYEFNEHLRQAWNYTLVDRDVFNVASQRELLHQRPGRAHVAVAARPDAVAGLPRQHGRSAHRLHRRASARISPASAAMRSYIRTKLDGTYYIPLDRFTGNSDWGIALSGGIGYFFNLGAPGTDHRPVLPGRRQSARLPGRRRGPARRDHRRQPRRPLHLDADRPSCVSRCRSPPDIGLSGRAFVDVGGLTQASFESAMYRRIPLLCRRQHLSADLRQCAAARRRRRGRLVAHAVRPHQYRHHAVRREAEIRPDAGFPFRFRHEVLVRHISHCLTAAILARGRFCSPPPGAHAQQGPDWFVPGGGQQQQPRRPRRAARNPAPRPGRARTPQPVAPLGQPPVRHARGCRPPGAAEAARCSSSCRPSRRCRPMPKGAAPPAAVIGVLGVPEIMRACAAAQEVEKVIGERRQKLNEDAQKEQAALARHAAAACERSAASSAPTRSGPRSASCRSGSRTRSGSSATATASSRRRRSSRSRRSSAR